MLCQKTLLAIVFGMTTKQELTYAQKFEELQPFYTAIFTCVKKDLRDNHLRADRGFFKRNFPGKELNKVTVDDFLAIYPKIVALGYENVGEFIANRWLLRHLDIYNFFEDRLKQHSENFDEIVELEMPFAKTLLDDAVKAFGAQNTYIFSVLNSVAFSAKLMKELRDNASIPTAAA